jgi:phospho-N-acetylmuramoyl-pentapeptide-transferase
MIAVIVAATVGFAACAVFTRYWIRFCVRHGIGQQIRQDGPQGHLVKAGTPTIGGLGLAAGIGTGFIAAQCFIGGGPTAVSWIILLSGFGATVAGFLDDWLKTVRARSLGLRELEKTVGLLALVAATIIAMLRYAEPCRSLAMARCVGSAPELPLPLLIALIAAVLWVTPNATNMTDGADGLLSGSAAVTFAAIGVVAYFQFRHEDMYGAADALGVAVIAAGGAGACLALLWWGAPPTKIMMGDTGSMMIGTVLATSLILSDAYLLLPLLGGLYYAEFLSSAIQRYVFKLSGRRRRMFRMAPIHHHFELSGWSESTVIIRFWIVNAILAAAAVALFLLDYIRDAGGR